jgi:hypothetical protein
MALDFPANPSDGEVFGSYIWSDSKGVWQSREESAAPAVVSPVPPTSPNPGDIWVDSSDGISYVYYDDGSSGQWIEMISSGVPSLSALTDRVTALESFVPISATGGSTSTITVNEIQWKVHAFTSVGLSNFVVISPGTSPYIEYLIVGGGGGGGCNHAGGGGAGAMITGYTSDIVKTTYEVSVGAGGAGGTNSNVYTYTGTKGAPSYIFGITAAGGGGGGGRFNTDAVTNPSGGGSGGGGAGTRLGTQPFAPGGAGSQLYGNDGGWGFSGTIAGNGGGGGGAGALGGKASGDAFGAGSSGAGGNGLQSSITGATQYYAGGGSGGRWGSGTVGAAGLGGGALGGNNDGVVGGTATANTGGGGGGGGGGAAAGGAGGSGIVIVRYPLSNLNA